MRKVIALLCAAVILTSNINTNVKSVEPDYPDFTVKVEIEDPYQAYLKAEEERIKAEEEAAAKAAEEAALAAQDASFINFDNYFSAVDVGQSEDVQSYIDNNMVTKYWGDWYHHNTGTFMNLFWQLDAGDTCQINGQTYTVVAVSHGYVDAIYDDNGGSALHCNGTTELITCDSRDNNSLRWIAYLQ